MAGPSNSDVDGPAEEDCLDDPGSFEDVAAGGGLEDSGGLDDDGLVDEAGVLNTGIGNGPEIEGRLELEGLDDEEEDAAAGGFELELEGALDFSCSPFFFLKNDMLFICVTFPEDLG